MKTLSNIILTLLVTSAFAVAGSGAAGTAVSGRTAPEAEFEEKSQLFPEATFVVGADTIVRVADPKYYQDEQSHRQAIETIVAAGCRFLVFGRQLDGDGSTTAGFYQLEDLVLPVELKEICRQVPAAAFRADISSTDVRARREEK